MRMFSGWWLRHAMRRLRRRRAAAGSPEGRPDMFRLLAESAHDMQAWFSPDGKLVWVNAALERLTGVAPEECLAAHEFAELVVYEQDRPYFRQRMREVLAADTPQAFELRFQHKRGHQSWMACNLQACRAPDGGLSGVRASAECVDARKETEFRLLETVAELRRARALSEHYLRRSEDERSRLVSLLDVVRLGILFMDPGHRVVYCNRSLQDIWGLASDENIVGVRDLTLIERTSHLLADPAGFQHYIATVLASKGVSGPHEFELRDGRIMSVIAAVVPGPQGERAIGRMWVFEDVSEQKRIASQFIHLAERDSLTNLYNRRRFHEELERMLAEAVRRHEEVGLLSIDLDGFKPINDTFGHAAGDAVLVGLAREVGVLIRRNEIFFRLGGDEFAILVPDSNRDELWELARRLGQAIAAMRFRFDDATVGITASIGIALYPQHGRDVESLLGAADRAMYEAKAAGRNSVRVCNLPPGGASDAG
ncbi:MAG: diguanylate cyclase [Zoogloea sp.]|nr:diguanylate cyclase [Zoogloea sp.]